MNKNLGCHKYGTRCFRFKSCCYTILIMVVSLLVLSACGSSNSSSNRSVQINAPFTNQQNGNGNGNGSLAGEVMFAEDIRDSEARFQRLEQAVVGIKKDVDDIAPTVKRLTRIESDLENVVTHLETILVQPEMLGVMPDTSRQSAVMLQNHKEANPVEEDSQLNTQINIQPAVTTMQPAATKPLAITPQAGDIIGHTVRYGVHENYTRIVIDVSGAAKFSADLMHRANVLMIEIHDIVWTGVSDNSKRTSFINGWKAHPMEEGKGVILSFELAKNSAIINQMTLENPYRLVVDLANLDEIAAR